MSKLLQFLILITLAFFALFSFGLASLLDGGYQYDNSFTTEADQNYGYDVAANLTKTGKSQVSFLQESGNKLNFAFVDSFVATKSLVKVGDDFGRLGKVVENPGIKIRQLDGGGHFLNGAINRGVTPDMILETMRAPRVVLEQSRGRYLYISDRAAVVVNQNGKAITTYGRNNFDDKVLDVLRKAGGQ